MKPEQLERVLLDRCEALQDCIDDQGRMIAKVTELFRRHAHPGCNAVAHSLCVEGLRILGVREELDTRLLDCEE